MTRKQLPRDSGVSERYLAEIEGGKGNLSVLVLSRLTARHQRIALIGLRGAGKSTLGTTLAERLELPFLELNQVIRQESGTFERLISSCITVWVKALPEEHMQRVIAQGDMRPIADLKRILNAREDLYRKADIHLDTSGRMPEDCVDTLVQALTDDLLSEAPATEWPTGTPTE